MQTLDRIPAAPPAGNAVPPPENHHGPPPPADFNQMMQQALAAKPKISPGEPTLSAKDANAVLVAKPAGLETSSAISAGKKISGKDSPTKATGKPEPVAAKTSTEPPVNNADVTILPMPDLPATPPVLVTGPLPGTWIPNESSVPVSTSTKNNSAIPTATPAVLTIDGKGAAGLALENFQADRATEKSSAIVPELSAVKPTPGSSSQKPEPVNKAAAAAADTEALLKNVAAAADKNFAVAEIPQPVVSPEPVVNEALEQKTSELAGSAAAPAAANDGTGVATVDLPMKKSANTNKVAGLAGKVLPGDAALPALEKVLPTPTLTGPVRVGDGGSTDSNFNQPMSGPVAAVDFSATPAVVAVPAFMEARLRNLERTHDMVALHAVRLVESQTDTLSVVIKPGAGTELSLQLRQRDGGIEAHAVLQRGDFQLMNQHWPELQQRLEQRGIKLAPLGSETNFSTDNGSSFKQQQQASQEVEAQKASAFAEFALAGSRALGATARLAVGVGGWESWA